MPKLSPPRVSSDDLAGVAGIAETALEPEDLALLPPEAPPAPWNLEVAAIVWLARGARRMSRHVSPAVRSGARPVLCVGAFVRYWSTPVGPYDEVFAGTVQLRSRRAETHVPFMAVDLPASVVGGRSNWALPKALARFDGDLREMTGEGRGWRVTARAHALGPALPFRTRGSVLQEWPDGIVRRASARASGRARPALVKVEVSGGEALRECLRPGAHLGFIVEGSRGSLGRARPA